MQIVIIVGILCFVALLFIVSYRPYLVRYSLELLWLRLVILAHIVRRKFGPAELADTEDFREKRLLLAETQLKEFIDSHPLRLFASLHVGDEGHFVITLWESKDCSYSLDLVHRQVRCKRGTRVVVHDSIDAVAELFSEHPERDPVTSVEHAILRARIMMG